jgi:stringent starvation protein B
MVQLISNTHAKKRSILAIKDFCQDSGLVPLILVWVDEHVDVPEHAVENNQLVINISDKALGFFDYSDEEVMIAEAAFQGVPYTCTIPASRIIAVYVRETSEGIPFAFNPHELPEYTPKSEQKSHPFLRVVK